MKRLESYARILTLWLLCCFWPPAVFAASTPSPAVTITLDLTPADTPADATIYVAGNFNDWQPGAQAYRMRPLGAGRYAFTLPGAVTGHQEFKFTLGSWTTVELNADGSDMGNRSIDVPASGVVNYVGEVHAWHKPAKNMDELQAQLRTILRTYHVPGMSIAIVRHDKIELIAGLGVADVASGRAATADTLFRIGSVSKNFAALAIMQLVAEGKLQLMDTVRQRAPEIWFENPWEATDPVRVVDLLEHTTGWDDIHFREYAHNGKGLSRMQALDFGHQSRVSRWRPGTRWAYCNSGPAVAAFIVEKISGQPFEQYVRTQLFTPIGMKSATFYRPDAGSGATLYRDDGRTPYPYREILYREAGAVNASAKDMGAYLAFYLQRGAGLFPPAAIERIETSTRTLAARAGISTGYGLYNYATVDDGVVYHGHDGGIDGGLSSFHYLPGQGAGYYFSINISNGEAFHVIERAMREFVAAGATKLALPAKAAMPGDAGAFAGWYEPAAPREELMHFLERLLGMVRLDVGPDSVHLATVAQQHMDLVPAGGRTLRVANAPVATSALVGASPDGQFILVDGNLMRRIPTWLALTQIGLVLWMLLAALSVLLYAPFWLTGCVVRRWRRPEELAVKLVPLLALASLGTGMAVTHLAGDDYLDRFGEVTAYSLALWFCTVLFAVLSGTSAVLAWKAKRRGVRLHAWFAASALLIATTYLAYWGLIGWRSWT